MTYPENGLINILKILDKNSSDSIERHSLFDDNISPKNLIFPKNIYDSEYFSNTSEDTDSLFNCLIATDTEVKKKCPLFKTKMMSNRGKVPKKTLLGKKHGKTCFDNILTKIQVHFISFLINMVNDAVKDEFEPEFLDTIVKNDDKGAEKNFFKNISYKEKSKIKYSYLMNCFQKPIKEIIQTDITKKFRNLKTNYNKDLYEKLSKKSEWFSDFLDKKFIEVFNKYYYNKGDKLEKIEFKGKTINISKNTKSFCYLLEKQGSSLAQSMKDIIKIVYLNDVKNENINEKIVILNKAKK